MKLFTLAIAGLAMLAGLAPAGASAQTVRERTVVTTSGPATSVRQRTVTTTRTTVRDDRRRYARPRYRTVCRTRWSRGERVRVCRRVRVYR